MKDEGETGHSGRPQEERTTLRRLLAARYPDFYAIEKLGLRRLRDVLRRLLKIGRCDPRT